MSNNVACVFFIVMLHSVLYKFVLFNFTIGSFKILPFVTNDMVSSLTGTVNNDEEIVSQMYEKVGDRGHRTIILITVSLHLTSLSSSLHLLK